MKAREIREMLEIYYGLKHSKDYVTQLYTGPEGLYCDDLIQAIRAKEVARKKEKQQRLQLLKQSILDKEAALAKKKREDYEIVWKTVKIKYFSNLLSRITGAVSRNDVKWLSQVQARPAHLRRQMQYLEMREYHLF